MLKAQADGRAVGAYFLHPVAGFGCTTDLY